MARKERTYDQVDNSANAGGSGNKIFIGIAILLVLGLGGYFSMQNQSSAGQQASKTTTEVAMQDKAGGEKSAAAAVANEKNKPIKAVFYFAYDQATIKSNEEQKVQQVWNEIKNKSGNLQIIGHADAIGTIEYNQTLSESRANNVASKLRSLSGTDRMQLKVHGVGSTKPVEDNNTEVGREQNRRVELIFTPNAN